MAALTLYATNSLAGVYQEISGTDPGAEALSSPVTGWTVSTGSTNRSEFRPRAERAATTFDATTYPDGSLDTTNGDGFRSTGVYTGAIASGNWTFYWSCRADTSGTGQDVRVHYRVFRSVNANGSAATQITSGIVDGSDIVNLSTSATSVSSASFNPGAVTLAAEYLFVQVSLERFGAASMTSADVIMRIGGANSTRLVTPNFTPSYTLTVAGMTCGLSEDNAVVTPHAIQAIKNVAFPAPSGYDTLLVTTIAEIDNPRFLGYGLAVEVNDRFMWLTTNSPSVDASGLVTGAQTVDFYWRDANNTGGTWSGPFTWISNVLDVQGMTIQVTQDAVFFPGNTVASKTVSFPAPAGYSTLAVTDISQAADSGTLAYHNPDLAVGHRIIYDSVTTDNAWPVTIDLQLFITIDSGGSGAADSFQYAIRDTGIEDSWGTWGTFALIDALAVADMTVGVSSGNVALTQHGSMAVDGMTIGMVMSEPLLLAGGALSVNGMTCGLSMGNVSLNPVEAQLVANSGLAMATIGGMMGRA